MRSLAAAVADLVGQRVLAEIPQLTLTVVTDHSAPTYDTAHTFGSYPIDGGSTPTLPFLQRITFPIFTMSHLPSPSAGVVDSLSQRILFTLANLPYGGEESLYEYLTANGRLDRALVSLDTFVVPPRELARRGRHAAMIYEPDSEGAAVSYFDGVIDRVVSVGAEIQCIGQTELPDTSYLKFVPDDGSDPRDRGVALPMPLGADVLVRCVNLVAGFSATTIDRVAIGDDEITYELAFGTVPTTGDAMLGAESIAWTGKSGNRLTGVTRAKLGTAASDHIVGAQIFQQSALTLGVASYPIPSVTALYVSSAATNQIVKVPNLIYGVDYDDETTAPGDTGDGITTVQLTAAQVSVVANTLVADAAVIQQADYQSVDPPTASGPLVDDPNVTGNTLVTDTVGATGTWTNVTSTPTFTYSKASSTRQSLKANLPGSPAIDSRLSLRSMRFGFDITVNTLTDTKITVGLRIGGMDGVLYGVQDGTIATSIELDSTGTINDIYGTTYPAADGALISDTFSLTMEFVKGEVSGGSAAVAFTVDDMHVEYEWWDDLTPEISSVIPEDRANVTAGGVVWEGDWVGGTTPSQHRATSGTRRSYDTYFLVDPFAGGPYEDLEVDSCRLLLQAELTDKLGSVTTTCKQTWLAAPAAFFTSTPADRTFTWTGTSIGVKSGTTTFGVQTGATSADFVGTGIRFRNEGTLSAQTPLMDIQQWDFEFTFLVRDPDLAPTVRLSGAQIQSAAGGLGLEFYALVDGPDVPAGGDYEATAGEKMSHPADLIRYWLVNFGGYAHADVDDTSFAAAYTNLGASDYVWGFDARNIGAVQSWQSALARMGYEARANIVRDESGDWKMLTASSTYAWGASVATLDSYGDLIAIGKDSSEIRTRLTVYAGYDPRLGGLDNQSYSLVQTTDPALTAVSDREDEFGILYAPPVFLTCHQAANGVTDWREYMEQELGRYARIWSGRFDHWQAYALEIGDIVTLDLGSETPKCRVIETQRDQVNGIQLRLVEVT